MHSLEALLAAWDVTRDPRWLGHALRITERVVHGFARSWNYRLPEHFDAPGSRAPTTTATVRPTSSARSA